MSFVNISNMTVRYDSFIAVHTMNLQIPAGEVFGFIGPNGAGKSTTMKVLATLLKPQIGKVFVDNIDVLKEPKKIRSIIGYMPDAFGVYDDLTVQEYLHFFAAAYRINWSKRKNLVNDLLALTDLTKKKYAQVDSLSRGMKQRLGIARVLIHDPKFLILDEPASGLDPRARIEMRELLKELRNMGKTVMISSHILSELSELCTRIGIIEAGKIVAEGSLEEIYTQLGVEKVVHTQILNYDEHLHQKISEIPGVTSVKKQQNRVEIHIKEQQLKPEVLLQNLIALDACIRMFQPGAIDLETVFMKLTEGKTA
ncbi:ATP-binding cassette domain-containing protein [Candidatus Uabimicrobium sp. HlEnr_7]|uniref:ABC transporter ATP-binding protein n=1 Tax=Candidatus Uabimicrobium helgolandensis TaxID=3095367 RepID=UPI003559007D